MVSIMFEVPFYCIDEAKKKTDLELYVQKKKSGGIEVWSNSRQKVK